MGIFAEEWWSFGVLWWCSGEFGGVGDGWDGSGLGVFEGG